MRPRIIFSDNGTLTDISRELTDYYSGTKTLGWVADQDSLYIGSQLPFNHIYISVSTTSAVTATATLAHYDGTTWQNVAETIDGTSSSGKAFNQSGFLEWTTNKNQSWSYADTPDITALSTAVIYDLYWAKINVSANLTVGLAWVGHLFSDDNQLGSEFPDLVRSAVKTAFSSTKTDWQEQAYVAANIIEKDIIKKGYVVDIDQVLDRDDLRLASVSKVAQLIYTALGDDYEKERVNCEKEYYKRLDNAFIKADVDKDARIDIGDRYPESGRLSRT